MGPLYCIALIILNNHADSLPTESLFIIHGFPEAFRQRSQSVLAYQSTMTLLWKLFFIHFKLGCHGAVFPTNLDIYEFGSRDHSYGGFNWDDTTRHPKPYDEPTKKTMSSLFQYLTPATMPTQAFPVNQFTVCWNMNVRVWGHHQLRLMRLFHDENVEWSNTGSNTINGDYWVQINFAPNRGTLIMTASMRTDKTKNNIWSGGLGNYTKGDNPLLRWGSFCMANDFQSCSTRYFIGKLNLIFM